jgi:chorismate dehydratase
VEYICEIKLYRLERKIRVGGVSYLNTKPLVYGLEKGLMQDQLDIVYDYPAAIARMLLADEIDVGLVPVAIIPRLKEAHLISDYCIGAENEVASVCLFSEVPLPRVEKVMLDYQSRTSVALTQLLIRDYWKLNPEFLPTGSDYRKDIRGATAGLVIGDRALSQRKISPYIYDLAAAWKDFTGLPFVFATWVSNKQLDEQFIQQFNEVNKYGLERIARVIESHPFADYDLHKYYGENISYRLTADKMKGLQTFLSMIGRLAMNP